jgi:succinoglycan biosynthesis protein ExoM
LGVVVDLKSATKPCKRAIEPAAPVDVCICTFHRPAVVEAILSAARQVPPPARILVIDNAETPEAAARVADAQALCAPPVVYVHAPSRNISLARNAALDAAQAEWLVFLDDDETAQPGWLAALLAQARASGADAVLGPVDAVYPPDAPAWIRALDSHSTRPVRTGGVIAKGYAGNAMLRRATVSRLRLRFDLALGRTGGEDDRFFLDLTDAGGAIAYAPDARALEPAPPQRLSLRWLLKRSFRSGQSHGARLLRRPGPGGRAGQVLLASAKAAACLAGALGNVLHTANRNRWLLRGALHAGVVARLAGRPELQMYGADCAAPNADGRKSS